MHKRLFITLLGFIILLAGCDYSKEENQTGIFYNVCKIYGWISSFSWQSLSG